MPLKDFDVIIIGGGVAGVWSTLDLTLRGLKVLLIERDYIGSGTSGKFHGLLHSGARYAVTDPKSAVECIQENNILSKIAPHAIEDTGGYFVSITKDDEEFKDKFIEGLKKTNIQFKEIPVSEALKEEPMLSKDIKSVIEVPDKVVFGLDLLASVELMAYDNGALFLENNEVVKIEEETDGLLIKTLDKIKNELRQFKARVVINAAGPWAGKVAKAAGMNVEVMPTAGTMTVVARRLTKRAINHLRMPSDGDILVPYGGVSIMGTTAYIIDDPDNFTIPETDPEFLISEGSVMVPELKRTPIVRSYASIRPLIRFEGGGRVERAASRDFQVIVHDRPRNLVSVVGGKFTTGRLMGEKVGDVVMDLLGIRKESTTKSIKLSEYKLENIANKFMGTVDKSLVTRLTQTVHLGMDYERGKVIDYVLLQYVIEKMVRNKIYSS